MNSWRCCWCALLAQCLLLQFYCSSATEFCCLPIKWHSHMTHTHNEKHVDIVNPTHQDQKESKMNIDVYVNYRRPKFELRGPSASHVFWRGHMWRFAADGKVELLNPVRPGFRPSGGYAPLFFRCLAPANGFRRISAEHYRLVESDPGPPGYRGNVSTVTDVFVRPLERPATSRRGRHSCLLKGFSVSSKYPQFIVRFGAAFVTGLTVWKSESGRVGWPDRRLTERTRAARRLYRKLLRSGRLQPNRPHESVPVTRGV